MDVDELDRRILTALTERPRISVLALARLLGIARGTAQARIDRLQRSGVIASFAPVVDPVALGYPVTAFVTVEISQGRRTRGVLTHLEAIPEVLEAHTITGAGDLLVRVVARSNADLQRVIDELVGEPDVLRSSTVIVLDTQIGYRTLPLVAGPEGEIPRP